MNEITSLGEWCDGQDPSVSLASWSFSFIATAFFMSNTYSSNYEICNSRIPEECLVCYQTSQCNWVIINMLYRYLQMCSLGWHRSRLGFVTPSIRDVSLALSVMHMIICLASNVTNELVVGWCITERVKRLAGNEIELGMKISTIEFWASNIPMTKEITYVVITVRSINIFIEYW